LKILMIGLTPPLEGGSQRHIYEISKRIDCDVLTQTGSMCKNKIEVDICGKGFIRNILFAIRAFFELPLDYDIYHVHENTLYWIAVLFPKKTILTIHGLKGFKFYDNKFLWFFYKFFISKANKVIVVSKSDKKLLERESYYIPNGVDLNAYGGEE